MSQFIKRNSIKIITFCCFVFTLFMPALLMAHGVSATDQETLGNGGLMAHILVGAKHMLTGYDHLLFLVGVVFFLKDVKDIIRFISFFTLGHSITLIV